MQKYINRITIMYNCLYIMLTVSKNTIVTNNACSSRQLSYTIFIYLLWTSYRVHKHKNIYIALYKFRIIIIIIIIIK